MTDWQRVPGYASHREGPEMPTVTVETERIREACLHARDELGFDMCVDVVATDYLGWGDAGVSGHIDFVCAQRTAFSSVVIPSARSSSSAPSSSSKRDGPFVGQSNRSDWSP